MSQSERERRVAELAHRIWEAEGRPDGQAQRHWAMAERLIEANEHVEALHGGGEGGARQAGEGEGEGR